MRRNVLKTKGANNGELIEEMVVKINVLRMRLGHEIGGQENFTLVVTKEGEAGMSEP